MFLDTVQGKVMEVHIYNSNDGWGYGKIQTRDRMLAFSGLVGEINQGTEVTMTGAYNMTDKYGEQFKMISFIDQIPSDMIGLLTYLESAQIKGIGKQLARNMVAHFRNDLLDVLNNDPNRLEEVPGIGKGRLEEIKDNWNKNREKRDIYIELHSYGVSRRLANKMYDEYGAEACKRIRNNPYILADEITGVGFMKADEIAHNMGYKMESIFRYEAVVKYVLKKIAANTGSCYVSEAEIVQRVGQGDVIDLKRENIDNETIAFRIEHALKSLLLKSEISECKVDGELLYGLNIYVEAERIVANKLRVMSDNRISEDYSVLLNDAFSRVMEEPGRFDLSKKQVEAIESCFDQGVTVITGGPGVGKTTIIKTILDCFERFEDEYVELCAPTGRAAKRLSEVTGRQGRTIHRLLEYNAAEQNFGRNAENPLECTTVIIEESSMIDTILMSKLLEACPDETRLIIVGDADQLPSVGAGNVLSDIINSGLINVIRLDTIYRQKAGSSIIGAAHSINRGDSTLRIVNSKDSDICFIRNLEGLDSGRLDSRIQATILMTIDRLRMRYDISDIQVLTPQKKESDIIGSVVLNRVIQQLVNENYDDEQCYVEYNETKFVLGDRVMQIRNNYTIGREGIFNGDIGFVTGVDNDESTIYVTYGGEDEVEYTSDMFDQLMLAYACTVHKSQGSEYPIVIIPCSRTHRRNFTRKLLYTATTRGKSLVVYVGDEDAFRDSINNELSANRYTLLKERLTGKIK